MLRVLNPCATHYRSEDLANINFADYIPDLTVHLFDTYNINSAEIGLSINVDEISLDIGTAIPCVKKLPFLTDFLQFLLLCKGLDK